MLVKQIISLREKFSTICSQFQCKLPPTSEFDTSEIYTINDNLQKHFFIQTFRFYIFNIKING